MSLIFQANKFQIFRSSQTFQQLKPVFGFVGFFFHNGKIVYEIRLGF